MDQIRKPFAGAIGLIVTLLLNWSPMRLIYRAWVSVFQWMGDIILNWNPVAPFFDLSRGQ